MERRPWAWRWALALLPADFRRRHAEELEEAAREHLAGKGRSGRAREWTSVVVDTLRAAWRLRRGRGRGEGGRTMGDKVWLDLSFAARALRRRPAFTAVAAVTLAVGIGANTAIFSVVDGVLLRPLPYPASDRIGILWHELGHGAQNLPVLHPLDLRDYRERGDLFDGFTMGTGREWILGGDDDPELVDVGIVEAGFFEFFGAAPILGRTIEPEEDVPGVAPVAVVLMTLFGGTALLLACVGIYGVLSHLVSLRTREIGVRLALGQSPRRALAEVVGAGMRLVAIALVIGVAGALALSRLMASGLYGVAPRDPVTYGAVCVVLVWISALACWIPARRATGIDPSEALRTD